MDGYTPGVLLKPILVAAFLLASNVLAQEAKVTPLLSKDLTEFPGKEGGRSLWCIRLALQVLSIGTMPTPFLYA